VERKQRNFENKLIIQPVKQRYMKYFYFFILVLFLGKAVMAQDVIYLADGSKQPGKVVEISAEKLKFKNMANPTGPLYTRSISNIQLAFNAAGNYLVFMTGNMPQDAEKSDFISETLKPRPFDVIIDNSGNILAAKIISEGEDITANTNGKDVKMAKASLVAVIRKNGTHELFVPADQAMPFLALVKAKIQPLLKQSAEPAPRVKPQPVAIAAAEPKPAAAVADDDNDGSVNLPMDMKLFGKKAIDKTKEFTGYLQSISSVNDNRDAATKSVNLACGLFVNEEAQIEVSNTRLGTKNKYKIRSYLNRLLLRSGQYDKIDIEYADINYASKFKKAADGNYYGVVTFVQKFQGFIDGNMVYGDITKRNVTIVLKHYEKNVNGEAAAGWDVFLADVGVVETKKL
jgi:hypothetical protein